MPEDGFLRAEPTSEEPVKNAYVSKSLLLIFDPRRSPDLYRVGKPLQTADKGAGKKTQAGGGGINIYVRYTAAKYHLFRFQARDKITKCSKK